MLSHVLLILTLLLQPLSLAFAGAPGAVDQQGMALRMTMPCCEPVVTTQSCCGEPVVVEVVCPKSDGPCQCSVQRHEAPTDLPAPMLRISEHIAPAFVLVEQDAVADVSVSHPAPATWAMPGAPTSHNRLQAFLGIWRT